MNQPYNIFIEGIPGSGKSTLLDALARHFTNYRVFREGDISPVELAWCAYMTETEYRQALSDLADLRDEIEKSTVKEGTHFITPYTKIKTVHYDFYEYMEKFEVYGGRKKPSEFRDIILRRFRAFHSGGNLFECSFFQNILKCKKLFSCVVEHCIHNYLHSTRMCFLYQFLKILYCSK